MPPTRATSQLVPKKIAVVMAHPDDAEFICAGTIARWMDEGHDVVYVLLTSGDKGSDDPEMTPERLAATREAEQREAARILGASDVIFMRCPDGELEPNLELRREIVRVIRRLKPDVVVCQDPTVRWVDTQYINHPDHRAAGERDPAAVFPGRARSHELSRASCRGTRAAQSTGDLPGGRSDPGRGDRHHRVHGAQAGIPRRPRLPDRRLGSRAHGPRVGEGDREQHPGNGDYVESFKYFKLD